MKRRRAALRAQQASMGRERLSLSRSSPAASALILCVGHSRQFRRENRGSPRSCKRHNILLHHHDNLQTWSYIGSVLGLVTHLWLLEQVTTDY